MKLVEVSDYQEMSRKAAELLINQIRSNPSSLIGLATGGTMTGTYRYLVADFKENGTSYKNIHTVNLDEYVGLDRNHPNSYYHYMCEKLFHHIDLPLEQAHLPDGRADDLEAECEKYETLINQLGGVDFQLLGIGRNGHIGFNEPGASFTTNTHVEKLTDSTRKANARFFDSMDEVPTHAITMGISTIMRSKKIVLLASGKQKADILKKLFEGEVDEKIPASILKTHPDVTIIADEKALSLVQVNRQLV